jgi:hypothetical protein
MQTKTEPVLVFRYFVDGSTGLWSGVIYLAPRVAGFVVTGCATQQEAAERLQEKLNLYIFGGEFGNAVG